MAKKFFVVDYSEWLDLKKASELHARLGRWIAEQGGPVPYAPRSFRVSTPVAGGLVTFVGELRQMVCAVTGKPYEENPAIDREPIESIDLPASVEIWGARADFDGTTWLIRPTGELRRSAGVP